MDSPGPGPGPGPGSKPRPRPAPSSVSVKSDSSKSYPPDFEEPLPDDKSSCSMDSSGPGSKPRPRPAPTSVSVKSDSSKSYPPDFKEPVPDDQSSCNMDSPGPGSKPRPRPAPSSVSVKSDNSKSYPPDFKEPLPDDLREPVPHERLDVIFTRLEEHVLTFVKEELKMFYTFLASRNPWILSESEEEQSSKEAVLNITVDFLRRMKQEHLAERLRNRCSVGVHPDKLKSHLRRRFSCVFEGVAKAGSSAPLQQIYTELYITEGTSEVNQEHETIHIDTASRKATTGESSIKCEDIFKQQSGHRQPTRAEHTEQPITGEQMKIKKALRAELTQRQTRVEQIGPIRTVLTKGVAGIGKTVLTQKFSLDWAEGRAHQDIQLLFPFTFRALNVLRDTEYSLVELVQHFFSQTSGLCSFENLQVLFIFDGLDECRVPLDFSRTRVLTAPTERASVQVLLVNLIRGSLLPSAQLWITTRPAAANQIPPECVSMVTEVRGFTGPQKEQYFRRRIRDKQQATAIISHMKASATLYVMCRIPVFCWILSTVLLHLMKTRKREELPQTLTQMYIYYLVVQAKVKNVKYHEGSETDLHWTVQTRKMVQTLGKLAFEQLQKGNLIFYESDLTECGLDTEAASVYSGVFTQVFREERGLYQDKVYCFIHLSVQEFLAALHVHQTFYSSGENLLSIGHSSKSSDPEDFYCSAVDQALQSPNGHLDLFLRFLLGLSLMNNQTLLSGLLTQTGSNSQTNQETVKYIKRKMNEGQSSERSLNLFHCLNELNDHSLVEGMQRCVREGRLCGVNSLSQWSAVTFILLSSDSDQEEFDLRKYQATEAGLLGLLLVIKVSTKAILSSCNLSYISCRALASVISSSSLTYLDLSNNDLQDSGVEQLCSGLKSASCRLETLRLSGCLVSEKGGSYLSSALNSVSSHLKELDLSYNHPGSSAELLTALWADPHNLLDTLRLEPAGEQWMEPGLRKYSCTFSLDPNTAQRNLLLSDLKQTVTRVEEEQQYPDHEDRFTNHPQVLSSTGLRGRCYWQVQWTGWCVEVAVSYRGIKRRGNKEESVFGFNDQSWALKIDDGNYSVHHKKISTGVSCCSGSSARDSGQVGVFLDSEAGALSFYEVSSGGELFHLHTFSSSFTEPLYPGFRVWCEGDSISII